VSSALNVKSSERDAGDLSQTGIPKLGRGAGRGIDSNQKKYDAPSGPVTAIRFAGVEVADVARAGNPTVSGASMVRRRKPNLHPMNMDFGCWPLPQPPPPHDA
jgi:hypothetical protein